MQMKKVLLSILLALGAGAAQAATDTASWATWVWSNSNGPLNGAFVQNTNPVSVIYSGDHQGVYGSSAPFTAVPTSFTSPTVTNTPLSSIMMVGGNATVNTFTFSQAVINPLVALWSVGQENVPVSFNFVNNPTFTILSQGAGAWAGGTLSQSGNSVIGREGNGVLQFQGTYTSISFTTPNYENYYGATVGALAVATVPEPETYAMLLAGLGLMGTIARRRKNKQA